MIQGGGEEEVPSVQGQNHHYHNATIMTEEDGSFRNHHPSNNLMICLHSNHGAIPAGEDRGGTAEGHLIDHATTVVVGEKDHIHLIDSAHLIPFDAVGLPYLGEVLAVLLLKEVGAGEIPAEAIQAHLDPIIDGVVQ